MGTEEGTVPSQAGQACDRICHNIEGEGQWRITDEGREWVESSGGKEIGKKDERKETTEIVPSQADPFKAEGKEELNRIKEQKAMSLLN